FLGKFLEVFLNAAAIGGRQTARIDVSQFRFLFFRGQLVGGLDREMLQLINELFQVGGVERQVALHHLLQSERDGIGGVVAAEFLEPPVYVKRGVPALLGKV